MKEAPKEGEIGLSKVFLNLLSTSLPGPVRAFHVLRSSMTATVTSKLASTMTSKLTHFCIKKLIFHQRGSKIFL